jgi:hypothetical protein
VADVNLIFSNAMTYNEEESQIWQDAFAMQVRLSPPLLPHSCQANSVILEQSHFAAVMQETPPDFVPPRKYNMSKRRGSSAQPDGSEDEDDGSEYGGGSRSGSVAPLYEQLLPPKQEEMDPFALANSGITTASPSLTPANGSPLITHLGLAPIPETVNPLSDLASLAGYGLNGVGAEASVSPVLGTLNGLNGTGVSRPASSRADSNEGVYHPRLVAKLPKVGEVPRTFSPSSARVSFLSLSLSLDSPRNASAILTEFSS